MGYYPSGGLGLVVVILIILMLMPYTEATPKKASIVQARTLLNVEALNSYLGRFYLFL